MGLLEGKKAIITGGSRGIGRSLCEVFAREGADIAFNYNISDERAAATVKEIESMGRRALSFKVSVTDRPGMIKMTRRVHEEFGRIDILVNNAAINRGDNFATMTERAWDEVIDTNVNGLFNATKPVFKFMMRQRSGHILNLTSVGAVRALPTAVHYATSKAAVIGFTKCLSREASPFGIASTQFARESSTPISRTRCRTVCWRCTSSGARREGAATPKSSPNSRRSWFRTRTAI